ncbi:MAG: hypothetical protein LQ337_005040 [Flavoplaca oasis]|nr:MAG: hypothetical protein LQ337_005040 [Flavoplaca oasis]
MVKKPISNRITLPYPLSPTSPSATTAGNCQPYDFESETQRQASNSVSSTIIPEGSQIRGMAQANHVDQNTLPQALRVGPGGLKDQLDDRPTTLPKHVGPTQLTPKSSSESVSQTQNITTAPTVPYPQSTNPYMRMRSGASQGSPAGDVNSTDIWANELVKPNSSANAISSSQPTCHSKVPFAQPWMDFKQSPDEKAFTSAASTNDYTSVVLDPTTEWNVEKQDQNNVSQQQMPVRGVSYTNELQELEAKPFNGAINNPEPTHPKEPPLPSISDGSTHGYSRDEPAHNPIRYSEEKSAMPPVQPESLHDAQDGNAAAQIPAIPEQQQAKANQQRNQTYQIRLVNWFDSSSPVNPRTSPIMVQNANGPCPLLALVNALTLSTPAGLTTALVETLRVREQVSLGLLLEAVIDELMSGRRGDAAHRLPDVSELHTFLVNLHTGMNVNPRFINQIATPTHLLDGPIEVSTTSGDVRKVGGFEDTPNMRLYATFAVPLIHGWLPRKNHPVCASLNRSAKTYEDAQSLLFVEEELENKLHAEGLTTEEQRLLDDVTSIKHFLTTSPTQLTDYGLDTLTETLRPGAIAILFRNDHFSTLFKEPRSERIFTLVTDLGYAGHDEVVWESLIDISGEGSEFFSGDFRPVGNNLGNNNRRSGESGSAPDDAGWTSVAKSGGRNNSRNSLPQHAPLQTSNQASVNNAFSQLSIDDSQNNITPSNTEQEDHDLALAMQLQEEEEDRERQETAARRRREDELSRAYLETTDRPNPRGGRPQVPPRGGGARRAPPKKSTTEEDSDVPPPTYEQAAQGPAYHPPASNPPPSGTRPRPNNSASGMQGNRPTRQTSAYSQTQSANAAFANAGRPTPPRRPPPAEKDKDCIMM